MTDIWNSAGLKLARHLHWRPEVELPAEEAWFLSLSFDEPHISDIQHPAGLWGEMARLACIWAKIQDLHRTSVDRHEPAISLVSHIDSLARELQGWCDSLPPFLVETRENLERAAGLGLGTCFTALHLGFHFYNEVLFYPLMSESHQSPSPLVGSYADQCAAHAQAFCDLLYLSEQTDGCRCL
jgi:hypothetical protein